MRIFEIENFGSKKLETFLQKIKEDTDPEILKIVLEYPLYRGYSKKPDNKNYGKYEIPKNRKPRDNILCLTQKLDDYLLSQGLKAVRSNSIFCTGSYSVARAYAVKPSKILRVIPAKNFSFTWNPKIRDFITNLFQIKDYFNLDIESFRNVENKKEKLFFVEKFVEILYTRHFSYHDSEKRKMFEKIWKDFENKNTENLDENYNFVIDVLEEMLSDESVSDVLEHEVIDVFIKLGKEKSSKICDFVKVDPNSNISYYTGDKSTLEKAISSGHEIMITGDYYYYFTDPFFIENIGSIRNILLKN